MKMRVLILGCGGIGSWFCHFLAHGIRNGVVKDIYIWVADGDKVEAKNLLYSNFDIMDIGKNKARVMKEKYGFKAIEEYIKSKKSLQGYDMIVIATDDGKSRKMVYDSGVYYIDLRSKGKGYAVFVKGCKNIEKTIEINRKRESCQQKHRLKENKIDFGNIVAASIGFQVFLNHLREENVSREILGYV